MRRLILIIALTLVIGIATYIGLDIFTKEKEENVKTTEITYEFDDSYMEPISTTNIMNKLENEDLILFIGQKTEEETARVTTILKEYASKIDIPIYYLEKYSDINNDESYQEFLQTYPALNNYVNFTPVILVFQKQNFIAGLPGGIAKKNLENFLKYTNLLNE